MNIFVLDTEPCVAASYHCDKHISKMILESAQMLSTVLGGPYKPTHQNHPCTKWVAQSWSNAFWLWSLAFNLNLEYKRRFNHTQDHKSWEAIQAHDQLMPLLLADEGITPFALAMPDEYKSPDPVYAYRAYYKSKAFAKWEHGPTPVWW